MLSAETIRLARVALFERGNMELDIRKARMFPLNDCGAQEARAYNELARVAVK